MTEQEKGAIIGTLNNVGAILPCSRCGNATFELVDGFHRVGVALGVNEQPTTEGPIIPVSVTSCNRCGNLSFHALGVLKLITQTPAPAAPAPAPAPAAKK